MTAPEAYIQYTSDRFGDDGEVLDEGTKAFLTDFMSEFRHLHGNGSYGAAAELKLMGRHIRSS